MAEETVMTNLDIKDFGAIQGLADTDYVVVSMSDGTSAKITARLLKNIFAPQIVDGVWHIGTTSTGVTAEGLIPEFRKGSLGIEYKYTTEDDTAWRLIVPYSDIKLQFDALTDAQKEEIFEGVYVQVQEEVLEPVNEAIANTETAVEAANKATKDANAAADAANKYANRVVDLTEAEWEALEETGTWVEGVEYNVYEV